METPMKQQSADSIVFYYTTQAHNHAYCVSMNNVSHLNVFMCVRPCVRVYMLMPTCVYAGVRAYPPVCVCTFLGSARELTGAEKTPTVTEETDIDAEDESQVSAAEELNPNRGVTDLDATAKKPELNHTESKVNHPLFICVFLKASFKPSSDLSPCVAPTWQHSGQMGNSK